MHYEGDVAGLSATTPDALANIPMKKFAARRYDVRMPQVVAYRDYLSQVQDNHLADIKSAIGRDAKTGHRYNLTRSGMVMELTPQEADIVRHLPGIKSVEPDQVYHMDTYRSAQFMGSLNMWLGSAPDWTPHFGAGVTVAVLDSGYNSQHPSFGNLGDFCGLGPAAPKVTSAVDCTGNDHMCNPSNSPDPTMPDLADAGSNPEDYGGHGSHTASTIAGNILHTGEGLVPEPELPAGYTTMSGVAPCANLRIYKVCGDTGCNGNAVIAAQEQAINDGDVSVLNFSISGGVNPWSTMTDTEPGFLDAFNAGIAVAASAGNTRPAPPAGTGPADPVGQVNHRGPWVLTVAASSNDLYSVYNGSISATGPGTPPAGTTNIGLNAPPSPAGSSTMYPTFMSATGVTLKYFPTNIYGCTSTGAADYPPGYFTGAVALVSRGGSVGSTACGFAEKVTRATAAGATGILIYNNTSGLLTGIGLGTTRPTIPVYGMEQSAGNALVNYLSANGNQITISTSGTPTPPQGDVLANFSLRGPMISQPAQSVTVTGMGTVRLPAMVGFDVTKPDITAPGIHIYAATAANPHDTSATGIPANYAYLDGTSMSSPNTAGALALLREAHPEWTVAELMSAIRMTATNFGGTQENGSTPWTPDQIGNGRVDLQSASNAGLTMDESYYHMLHADPNGSPPGDPKTLNLPSMRDTNCRFTCTWTRTVTNATSRTMTYNVSAADTPNLHFTVSPSSFTLQPRGSCSGTLCSLRTDQVRLTITAKPLAPTNVQLTPLAFGTLTLTPVVVAPDYYPTEQMTIAVQGITDEIFGDNLESH